MIFESVWLSSAEHLQKFERAYHETSFMRRLVGAWKLPQEYPFIRGWMGRIPLVMFSIGTLRIEDRLLHFESQPYSLPFNQMYQLRTDLRFTLTHQDITAIEQFVFVSPCIRYYSIPFVSIHTNKDGVLEDFLLCAGALGPGMGKIRQRTETLLSKLKEEYPAGVHIQPSPPTT